MNKYSEEGTECLIICNALDEELRRLMRDFEEIFIVSSKPIREQDLDEFKEIALIRNKYMAKEKECRRKSWEEYKKEKGDE